MGRKQHKKAPLISFPKLWSFWWCSHSLCTFSSLWQRGVETAKHKVSLLSSSLIKMAWFHSCSIWRNEPTIFHHILATVSSENFWVFVTQKHFVSSCHFCSSYSSDNLDEFWSTDGILQIQRICKVDNSS